MKQLLLVIAFFALGSSCFAQTNDTEQDSAPATRMTPELLWKLGRLGEAAVSPDGSKICYTVRRYDLSEDSGKSSLIIIDAKSGAQSRIIGDWKSISSVQWANAKDAQRVYFVGLRGESTDEAETAEENQDDAEETEESPQVWSLDVTDGKTVQLSNFEDGIANLKVSPTGTHVAFTMDIKLDEEVTELYPDLPKADARVIDGLMYRHWNAWHDYKYSHLHIAPIQDDGTIGEATDLLEGIKADCPVPPFGGSEQFNWSPDGKEIAYTIKNVKDWAQSTNSDVYIASITDPTNAQNVTKGMEGYDNNPVYSPDGKFLAFHSMERASFEADRNRIMLLDRASKSIRDLTDGLDQTAHDAVWTPDSKAVMFVSEFRGTNQLFRAELDSTGAKQISEGRFNWSLIDILPDGDHALVSQMNMLRPKELVILDLTDASYKAVSDINGEIYANLELPKVEERWVDATDGKKIHCWVIHPPEFDATADRKWPMLTYCQGGPQGQIGQWFSYRWNFHLMAANGYVVVAPNRRGLPGFGREWNDQISGDWGGQAMKDILSATDNVMREPYVDDKRVGAIGASFGGYTVYWLMGNHNKRFCSMVAHCGVFNLESMYGSTEELFFVNWDLGGPYWKGDTQKQYNQFSPNRFVGKWETPLMVVHGEKDFRVPVTQGMEAFTAAQVQGVPSRFLYYPNEGHWVQKPQNGVLWHRVFFDWLDRYCKPKDE